MARFPLPADLAALHDDVIRFASATQVKIATTGGCQSMASEALNALSYNAVLTHRGIRTLCEEGWAPLTSILIRTLLDVFANCVAVVSSGKNADYMGFKYMSDALRKWLEDPEITIPERDAVTATLDGMVCALPEKLQPKARRLIARGNASVYFFQPEFQSTRHILEGSTVDMVRLYRFYSPASHGGFASKIFFHDNPQAEDIEPRPHLKRTKNAIVESCRLTLEVWYIRDQVDNLGVAADAYRDLVRRIVDYK